MANRSIKNAVTKSIKAFRKKSKRSLESQELIQKFHELNAQLEKVKKDKSLSLSLKKQKIDTIKQEIDKLGGLSLYQKASLLGNKFFNSSTWLIKKLEEKRLNAVFSKDHPLRLLDVGALDLNYKQACWISAKAIDLHPQLPSIEKADFFELDDSNMSYDVVAISLVLNFVGSPDLRGMMIKKAFKMTANSNGYVYIVLPLYSLENSALTTANEFAVEIEKNCCCRLVDFSRSKKLIFFLFQTFLSLKTDVPSNISKLIAQSSKRPKTTLKNDFSVCFA